MNITYRRVLWRQVWGLAALLAAILFSWMAYSFYQPVILTQLGFVDIAQSLGIIQGLMGAAIEPLAGAISDRIKHRIGSRLPAIAVGIVLAGLLFVAIGILLHGNIPPRWRWTIPMLMTFWVIAMIVFRGPSISLLRQFAPTESLPVASAILTLIFGLVGSIGPIFERVIQILGAANTFLLGAVMLMVGAILLWSAEPQVMVNSDTNIDSPISHPDPKFLLTSSIHWQQIFGMGLVVGTLVNILLRVCPQKLHQTLSPLSPEYLSAGILFICAIAAIPLEKTSNQWGINRSMTIGLILVSIAILMSSIFNLTAISIAIILLGGIAMGILFVAQVPWCLSRMPPERAGLSTGLYFGGMGAATALLTFIIVIF